MDAQLQLCALIFLFPVSLFIVGGSWPKAVLAHKQSATCDDPSIQIRWWSRWHPVLFAGFVVCLLQFVLHLLSHVANFEVLGMRFNLGSTLFFPLVLAVPLFVVVAGTYGVFRFICCAIIICNLLAAGLTCIVRNAWAPDAIPTLLTPLVVGGATNTIIFGATLQFFEVLLMIAVYFLMTQRTSTLSLRFGLPLLVALVVDSFLYSFVVVHFSSGDYTSVLGGQIIGKTISGLIYTWIVVKSAPKHDFQRTSSCDVAEFVCAVFCLPRSLLTQPDDSIKTRGWESGHTPANGSRPHFLETRELLEMEFQLSHRQFQRDLPELLRTDPDKWVVYDGRTRIGIADDKDALLEECWRKGHSLETLYFAKIEPAAALDESSGIASDIERTIAAHPKLFDPFNDLPAEKLKSLRGKILLIAGTPEKIVADANTLADAIKLAKESYSKIHCRLVQIPLCEQITLNELRGSSQPSHP